MDDEKLNMYVMALSRDFGRAFQGKSSYLQLSVHSTTVGLFRLMEHYHTYDKTFAMRALGPFAAIEIVIEIMYMCQTEMRFGRLVDCLHMGIRRFMKIPFSEEGIKKLEDEFSDFEGTLPALFKHAKGIHNYSSGICN